MTSINQLDDIEQAHTNQELILGLTLNAEIIQFNTNLEQVTGYQRDEVIHKKFEEILLSTDSIPLWNTLLESIRQNMWIDEFVLPLKTKKDQPYMISWTGFFIKDEHGSFKDICLIGKPLVQEVIRQEPSAVLPAMPTKHAEQDVPVEQEPVIQDEPSEPEVQINTPEPILRLQTRELSVKHGRNKILFAKEKTEIGRTNNGGQKPFVKPNEIKREPDEKDSETYDSTGESNKEPSGKYGAILERLDDLETKDRRDKKSHKKLKRISQKPVEEYRETEETKKNQDRKGITSDEQRTKNSRYSFFSDPFGFRRQRDELVQREQQLDVRSKQLDALQSHLLKEQHTLNIRVEELGKWREKLELLELAIEKRRQELMRQEDIVLQKSIPIKAQRIVQVERASPEGAHTVAQKNDETLDKIPHSAAIIQRGILKQINTLFLEFLGYTMDEIIEKSFFDFIALEGLADVEKYYLDRLKGDNVSVYNTVFITKDNHKITAEVSIKQTIYNSEKAEIAIITCLESNTS